MRARWLSQRVKSRRCPSERADYARAALWAARLARDSAGTVRLAHIRPLPPPRLDRHGRIVADTDREMARIIAEASERLARLAAEFEEVPVERVVRFGQLAAELSIEAEGFHADLVALAAPLRPGLRERLRHWYLERVALASKVPLILLPPRPKAARVCSDEPGLGSVAVPNLKT